MTSQVMDEMVTNHDGAELADRTGKTAGPTPPFFHARRPLECMDVTCPRRSASASSQLSRLVPALSRGKRRVRRSSVRWVCWLQRIAHRTSSRAWDKLSDFAACLLRRWQRAREANRWEPATLTVQCAVSSFSCLTVLQPPSFFSPSLSFAPVSEGLPYSKGGFLRRQHPVT